MSELNLSEPEPGLGLLADYLVELLKRFHHFSGPMERAPGMGSHLARIKVSARLLATLDRPSGPVSEGFVRLSGVLKEWVTFFESSPESFPLHLCFPLEQLADYLEELLARRDQGAPAVELERDVGWCAVLASFRHAGTPLAVLEEVDDIFRRWGRRWNEENLTPVQEQHLCRRWTNLRKKGDVLFHLDDRPDPRTEDLRSHASGSPEILLLVDSTFRRDQIRDKLTDREYRVKMFCDPVQVLEFLATGPAPRAVLCDNLEPTRHLACLREGLSSVPGAANVPLVLVVGNSLTDAADQDRACSLGAVAAWREPFDPVVLNRILQRPSHP